MDFESGDVFGPPDITQYDTEGPPDITQYDSEGPPDITKYGPPDITKYDDSSSGSGASQSKDADWLSIFNTGVKTVGDVVTKTVDATKKNTTTPTQAVPPKNTIPVTPTLPQSAPPTPPPASPPMTTTQPAAAGSTGKTIAIVAGGLAGLGLVVGVGVALSSSGKSSRRGGF